MRAQVFFYVSLLTLTGWGGMAAAQTTPRVRLEAPVPLDTPVPLVDTPTSSPIVELGDPVSPGAIPQPRGRVIRAQNSDERADPEEEFRLPSKQQVKERIEQKFGFDEPIPQGSSSTARKDDILDRPASLDPPSGAKQVSGVAPVARSASDDEEMYNSGFVETRVPQNSWLEKQAPKKKTTTLTADSRTELEGGSSKKGTWWSQFGEVFSSDSEPITGDPMMEGGGFLQCDAGFANGWISPMTNSFLAEDPRSLTELRPIFLYQVMPEGNPFYNGGNIESFVLQGRIAFTEKWSLVIHKLGGMWIQPGGGSVFGDQGGFTEIWLGPKWTFLRGTESRTLMATGLQFQIPIGASQIYQNTEQFSMVPYLSIGQKFWTSSIGTWTVQDTLGYSFSIDGGRSDFIYNTLHLDLDIGDNNKIFPLIELNWFRYTTNGTARPGFNFEGRDLANVGAPVNGRNYLSLAAGARYKFSERFQLGAAAEFPLSEPKDLFDFRFTFDMTFRY